MKEALEEIVRQANSAKRLLAEIDSHKVASSEVRKPLDVIHLERMKLEELAGDLYLTDGNLDDEMKSLGLFPVFVDGIKRYVSVPGA